MPFVNNKGNHIYYEVKGNGTPIVFVHPPVFPSEVFQGQVNDLSQSYRTVFFDLRGHGNSSPSQTDWDFSDIAEDLLCLFDHIDVKTAWICGYSAGASVAFEFTKKYPERVEGLIQIGTAPKVADPFLKGLVKGAMFLAGRHIMFPLAFVGSIVNINTFDRFLRLYKASRRTNAADAHSYYKAFLHYSCHDWLPSLEKPVLLVYGEKDRISGRYADESARLLPNNQLVIIKKSSHEVPGNHTREFNNIIRTFIR
ncbi:alpha/beta fold hydrolase [Peribacillus sp. SCS-155]|uniref:alpha/beta fold hydrolase n=1 Tax=Peribacillus sedimenti TaxID=3115297 RepID=UPI003905EAF8